MSSHVRSIAAYEQEARTKLPKAQWAWVTGAAESGATFRRNRSQFREFGLRPAVLTGITTPILGTHWAGAAVSSPILAAPIGHLTQFHESGELGVMKGCRDTGNHCVISMHTRRNLEILAQSVGSAGWSFQVYLYSNPDIVAGQIERAVRLGSRSVIITVDSSHRSPSYERQQHPWDARNFGQRDEVELPESRDDRAWTWKMLEDLIRSLRVPVAIKGVQSPTDALRAKEAGARVVWISNHGGRANETDQSLLREVTAIRGLVGPDVAVVVDGGFRTGTDIAKALLLGASHVALGRPLIYGLVSAGSQGVANVLGIANRELSLVLGSLGIRDVSDAAKHAEQVFETRERDSRPGD